MAETVSAYTVADMFLRALGAPTTPAMRRAVAIWLRFESGGTITGNNPWNLHGGAACPRERGYCPGNVGVHKGQIGNRYAGPGDQNVAVFGTLEAGTRASAQNLIRLAPSYGYGAVINEARSGDALGFLRALQNSSWSAGHYGYTKLVNAFRGSFNYNTTMTLKPVGGGTTGTIPVVSTATIEQQIATFLGKKPSDTVTQADIDKLVAAYGGAGIAREIFDKYLGKTIHELAQDSHFHGAGDLFGIPDSVGDIGAAITDAIGEVGDVLLFILGITVGGILVFYGMSMLLTAGREERPAPPKTPVVTLPKGSTIHVP